MAPAATAKPRDLAFEAFRGLAIAAVVLGHAQAPTLQSFPYDPSGQGNFYFTLCLRQVLKFAVPCFLFVSGYWLAHARIESWGDYRAFLRKRVSRIAIPYLGWSLFFIALRSVYRHSFSLTDTIQDLLLGQAQGPYWFIVMLLQFYVLAPLFIAWGRSKSALRWIVVCHVIAVGASYGLRFYIKDLPFTYYNVPFVMYLTFFSMGIYLRLNPAAIERIRTSWVVILMLVTLLLSLVEALLLLRFGYIEFATSPVKLSCFCYSVFVLIFLLKIRHLRWPRVLVLMGEYSFGIYFMHSFLVHVCETILRSKTPLYAIQPIYQLAVLAIVTAACCIIIMACRKILGRETAATWLGF